MSEDNNSMQPALSQTRIALRRLRRHRLAMWALGVLVVLYTMCIFADFIAPYNMDDEQRDISYCPLMYLKEGGTAVHCFQQSTGGSINNGKVLAAGGTNINGLGRVSDGW